MAKPWGAFFFLPAAALAALFALRDVMRALPPRKRH